jgi:tagatose 6-phosphate kinase
VVSLGADGLLAVTCGTGGDGTCDGTGDGIWHAAAAPVTGNATGAGDAVVAGLADGLVAGRSWPDTLRQATALGAAAVAAPVAGEFCDADYQRALDGVRVAPGGMT